jgi:RimJ/RimL family protein N-acetyltransferase
MHRVRLVPFTAEDVEGIESWFDDLETQRRLGGRDWIRREPSLLGLMVGDVFRGRNVTGRRMWLSMDELDEPVAVVDGEMYERYATWDGSDWDHPVVWDVVEAPSMGLTLVVDPARRRRGYGTATLRAIVEHPDVSHIQLFFGGVEQDNVASIACLTRAGFHLRSPEPNFEGMLFYSLER